MKRQILIILIELALVAVEKILQHVQKEYKKGIPAEHQQKILSAYANLQDLHKDLV